MQPEELFGMTQNGKAKTKNNSYWRYIKKSK
jgi:hypothetical protein